MYLRQLIADNQQNGWASSDDESVEDVVRVQRHLDANVREPLFDDDRNARDGDVSRLQRATPPQPADFGQRQPHHVPVTDDAADAPVDAPVDAPATHIRLESRDDFSAGVAAPAAAADVDFDECDVTDLFNQPDDDANDDDDSNINPDYISSSDSCTGDCSSDSDSDQSHSPHDDDESDDDESDGNESPPHSEDVDLAMAVIQEDMAAQSDSFEFTAMLQADFDQVYDAMTSDVEIDPSMADLF